MTGARDGGEGSKRSGWTFPSVPSQILAVLAVIILACQLLAPTPSAGLPSAMLWAWERPEDLTFLDCTRAGVAVLAKTLTLADGEMRVEQRRQPILLPDGCPTVGVVRIEAAEGAVKPELIDPVAREFLEVAGRPGIAALQIDFDALTSQRPFYRELLNKLKPDMPDGVRLTITALASWCLWDDWLTGLPIDDAIPMLFQMGIDDHRVRRYLDAGDDFRAEVCRSSLGLSTDEWPARVPHGRRDYIFHPRPWSAATVSDTLRKVEAWK